MNRRGKPPESIENLKADFVAYLKEEKHDFTKADSYDRKFDHAWADMAWGRRESEGFDLRYLRLFNRYFYNLWIMNNKEQSNTIPDELKLHFTAK